jgi:large subunit ribosomal protein L15
MANELHNLKPAAGATKKRKRVGRGPGSGTGKTAGRGHKGQKSRSGYSRRYGFEGGQMPLVRRIPKRGFTNIFRVGYQVVNLRDLDRVFAEGDTVTPEAMTEKGLIRGGDKPVKVLAAGELGKKLSVRAHAFSKNAKAGIEAAGGSCEEVTS